MSESLEELKHRMMFHHNGKSITPESAIDILHNYMEWREQYLMNPQKAENAALLKAARWIPVSELSPPPEVNFLSFSNVYGFQVSMYSTNPSNSNKLLTLAKLHVTHWMPLPTTPDKQDD